jgi:hypothetical protein
VVQPQLRETIKKLGAGHMAKDMPTLLRIKAWLVDNVDGNWTEDWVRQALEAVTMRAV